MSPENPAKARSRKSMAVLAILALCAIGYGLISSDRAKLTTISESITQAEKLQAQGNPAAAKAILGEIVASSGSCWFETSAELSLSDKARVALARIHDREGETTRAVSLLESIRSAGSLEQARTMLGRFEARKALAEAAAQAASGQWAQAERNYRASLDFSRETLPHRLTFRKILQREGRAEEARQVYAGGIFAVEKPQDVLHSLWIMDSEEPRVSEWEAEIATAAALAPGDPGVQLARAYLARLAGRFDEAFGILRESLANRDGVPAEMNAALRRAMLALALDSPAHFDRAIKLVFTADAPQPLELSRTQGCLAIARICAALDRSADEKLWYEKLLIASSYNRPALSRLAELAREAGDTMLAGTYDEKKNESERLYAEYTLSMRKTADPNAAEAAKLAETAQKLGLPFDAWAWRGIAGKKPLLPEYAPKLETIRLEDSLPQSLLDRFRGSETDAPTAVAAESRHLAFEDVAEKSGLAKFVHINGGKSKPLTPPLSFAGGLAVFDYDADGHLDVFAVQGGTFPPDPEQPGDGDRLFRNRGDGTFDDVTAKAGIDRFPKGFGHGVTAGDFDNDGRTDLFVTRWRSYALYRNRGEGMFEDVTVKFGLGGDRDWPTSAAFADLDGDGDLDLYVCHYLEWIEGKSYPCVDPTKPNTYDCRPRDFPAMPDRLYRNDGDTFVDVSAESGLAAIDRDGRGLGVVAVDVNDDRLVDLFVANDTTANYLLINRGGMKFEDDALASGVAANAQGGFQAGMGVAAADVDGDGLPDLAVTNFFNESTTIFQNLGGGLFADRTAVLGVAAPSRFLLGFGILLTDFDNDGTTDYMTANGHVTDGRPAIPWRMPLQVLRGTRTTPRVDGRKPESRFVDDSPRAGADFSRLLMARALASGDLDGDGLLDVVAQSHDDPLVHLKNTSGAVGEKPAQKSWIAVELKGTKSNREGIGAVITARLKDGTGKPLERRFWKTGGGSFQSSSAGPVHIGLGASGAGESAPTLESIHVRWPSGMEDVVERPVPGRKIVIQEGASAK